METNPLSDEQIERLAIALVGKLNKYLVVVRPMNGKEAIAFTGRGESTFYRWVSLGVIKQYRPDPNGDPVYFADQIVEGIREAGKSKKSYNPLKKN